MSRHVVVVGGGVTGLATAWLLRHGVTEAGTPADLRVTLVEAEPRLGGKIAADEVAGTRVDVGADAFLARRPEAERLARRLGLGEDLVAPATGQVFLWVRGRLRPMPDRTVMGVPSDLVALARSGVLTTRGLARAAVEPLLPRRARDGDTAVGDLVGDRFGREVVDTLVEPLLGGVYAGRADRLSLDVTAPALATAAGGHASLLRGVRDHRAATAQDDRPVFLTVVGGLTRLVERLADGIDDLRTGVAVTGLAEADGRGLVLSLADGGELAADDVVVTVPAYAAAPLLAPLAPEAARLLAAIRYASVAVVSLAYPPSVADAVPDGSGMLVPRTEGRLVKAATWSSRKWPHLAGGGHFLLRASVGRVDDDRLADLGDDALVTAVADELAQAIGLPPAPVDARVTRWDRALPQYEVGHRQRVDAIRAAARRRVPRLHLAGAAYDGVGLAPCVAQAEAVAAAVTATATP